MRPRHSTRGTRATLEQVTALPQAVRTNMESTPPPSQAPVPPQVIRTRTTRIHHEWILPAPTTAGAVVEVLRDLQALGAVNVGVSTTPNGITWNWEDETFTTPEAGPPRSEAHS